MSTIDLHHIAQRLNALPFDIRVEVLLADLLDSGINEEQLLVQPISIFKRRHAKDIENARVWIDQLDDESLRIDLTRDGLYDLLPEGLFHQPRDRKHYKQVSEMVQNVKTQRKEEQEARLLFAPLENELYLIRTALEREEKRLFYELENNISNQFLIDFWNLNAYASYATIPLLLRLMPVMYRLSCNNEYVRICYEMLLQQEVDIKVVYNHEIVPVCNAGWLLGDAYLTYTTTLSQQVKSEFPSYEIHIVNVPEDKIASYLPGGYMRNYLDMLHSYFLPIAYEKKCIIEPQNKTQGLDLKNNFLHVGINTTLN